MRHRWIPVACALALAFGSRGEDARAALRADAPPTMSGGPDARVPYDHAIQKSTHNAYARDEPLFDQLVWHRLRSVELDIHAARAGTRAGAGDFFVYHADQPFLRDSSCTMLSDCLGQIAAFHRAMPEHEVVTLWVDLKDDFEAGHMPADLDAALARALGREALVTPRDLIARCPGASTVRGAVTGACTFPSLAELRGKVLIAVTGGTQCNASSHVSAYAGTDAAARLAFVAPNIDDSCDASAYDRRPSTVFLNMPLDERAHAAHVRSRGLVARIYGGGLFGGLDSAADFADARAAGAQHLASDRVNADQDRFASTASPLGFPLQCADCVADGVEQAALIGLRAQSGDIAGEQDSFYFASATDDATSAVTWSTFVSVPSSHADELAKGCLMARASDAPDAANVALCRTFDKHPPRLQVRAAGGAVTTTTDMAAPAGLSAETPAFLRLTLTPAGASTEAHGEASSDGISWTTIARTTVSALLPQRGLALASHGGATRVRSLFGNVVRTQGNESTTFHAARLPSRRAIGAHASGEAFDGVLP